MASAYRNANRLSDESASDSDTDDMSLSGADLLSTSSADDDDASNASDDSSPSSSSDEPPTRKPTPSLSAPTTLRNRILMLTSRGVSHRQRHLLNDLSLLLPHTYKDTKLDTKSNNNYNASLNALADLHSCNYIFFLEARKHAQDLYLWLSGAPNGPTVKFSVTNLHTMAELGFEGNCLKGGRGTVVFDQGFDAGLGKVGEEYRGLIREMLKGVFCVPERGVRGMKPFIDRIIGVYALDGKIWIRVYEIREAERSEEKGEMTTKKVKGTSEVKLLEVGPRMVLTPIVVLEGSFGGPVIYENKQFVSGNQLRKEALLKKSAKYADRRGGLEERTIKRKTLGLNTGAKRRVREVDDREIFG